MSGQITAIGLERRLLPFQNARITAFEPQKKLAEKHKDLEKDGRVVLHYQGVGDFDGTAPFTFHPRDDSSSFVYSAGEASDLGFEQEEVEIRRLDTVVEASDFGMPELIKIDAEGLDLKVLDGAPHAIVQAEIVLIEATVACPEYPNTVALIIQRMAELGFRMFDITDLNRTPEHGVLWLIEAVFVRNGSSVDLSSQYYR